MNVPVTLLYGGLCALLLTLLGLNVTWLRLKGRVRSSQPLPAPLLRPWRAHGNAAEWIPIGIVLLLALELSGRIPRAPLHALGGTFFLGRALHAAGHLTRWRVGALGAGLTYLVLAVLAGLALWARLGA